MEEKKIEIALLTGQWNYGEEIDRLVFDSITDWDKVTEEEYNAILTWATYSTKQIKVLVRQPLDMPVVNRKIKEIAEEALKKQETENKRKQEYAAKKEERERKKAEKLYASLKERFEAKKR